MLLCIGFSANWGLAIGRIVSGGTVDFQALYYGTKCLMHQRDPYDAKALEHAYIAEGGQSSLGSTMDRTVLTLFVNLPSVFVIVAPFAMLSWGVAKTLWLTLIMGSFLLAAYLMRKLGENFSPRVSLILVCLVLANSEALFANGNTAGIVVSFCLIAVWCFLRDRSVPAGVLCLAISLVIKPHDVGFVWLYFLLAGGTLRKRALHTLALTACFGLAATLWISHFAPHWQQELRANLTTISMHGGLNDPGVESSTARKTSMVISLQAAFSVFSDDPHFYNPMSYLVSGALLLVWAIKTVRTRFTQEDAWLALAAVSALSLLPVYHRAYDAKLLLLAIPACAMLWAEGGSRRWLAFGLTVAGIASTSDIPLAILLILTRNLHFSTTALAGKLMTLLLLRPTSIILLAMGCFYLWVYVRYDPGRPETMGHGGTAEKHIVHPAT